MNASELAEREAEERNVLRAIMAAAGKTTGLVLKLKAGESGYGQTAMPDRDTWIYTADRNIKWGSGANPAAVVECRWIGPGNATAMNSLQFLFQGGVNMENVDVLLEYDTSNATGMKDLFNNCAGPRGIIAPRWNLDKVTTLSNAFFSADRVTEWDLSGCSVTSGKLTNTSGMFQASLKCTTISLAGWNTRNVTTWNYMFYQCPRLGFVDFTGVSTRSMASCTSWFAFSSMPIVKLSPEFFEATAVAIPLNMVATIDNDNHHSMMIAHIAEVAPTIRSKEGYGDVPEEEGGVPLLEQENGVWYLNDGVGRTIAMSATMKSQSYSPQYLAILQSKGYTIA